MSFAGEEERRAQRMQNHEQGLRNWVKAVDEGTKQVWTTYANDRAATRLRHDKRDAAANIVLRGKSASLPLAKTAGIFALVGLVIAIVNALSVQHLQWGKVLSDSVVGIVVGATTGAALVVVWTIIVGLAKLIVKLLVFAFWIAVVCGLVWVALKVLIHR